MERLKLLTRIIRKWQFENKSQSFNLKNDILKEIEAVDEKEVNNTICEVESVRRTAIKSELGLIELKEARY